MKLRGALLAASVVAMPMLAFAQPVTGLYIGAGLGPEKHQQEDIKNLSIGSGELGGLSTSGEAKFGIGFAGLASLGWGFGNGLRVEAEGDYLNSPSNGFTGGSRNFVVGGGGREQKYGFMANVLYDFVGVPVVQPYLGAGVGVQWVNWKNFHAYNAAGSGDFTAPNGDTVNIPAAGPNSGLQATSNGNSKAVFAYQAIAGVALPIAAAPGLALTAEYRFLGTAGNRSTDATFSVSGTANGEPSQQAVPGKVQFGPTYDNIFLVGFRYNFGQAPAPAPAPIAAPAPAVQPARSYLVFFDWDKATLTDRARQIIKEAAANSTHVQYTRIEVNGYTDTSGTPQYNMGLSVRRASAVKAELIKDGVPAAAIATQGFGETHLLVPTGPGVREPQNRRVEIIIR
jgi:outer membrane protein OmpA-like peptidoglycan-associated protein